MGFGFPAAIGAKVACPDKEVVCVAGDGSFQMNSQEMATAAAEGINVKVLLMNNSALGMVHQCRTFSMKSATAKRFFRISPIL